MLHLKRMRYFNEIIRDTVDDRMIGPGEYYYEDDEDGTIISADHYYEIKKQRKEDEWDYSKLDIAQDEKDYKESLRQAEQEFLQENILDRIRLHKTR